MKPSTIIRHTYLFAQVQLTFVKNAIHVHMGINNDCRKKRKNQMIKTEEVSGEMSVKEL